MPVEPDTGTRPRLLDLFCGAGGCARGYHRAGFDVVGVDLKSQPHYPFDFIKCDALMVLRCLMEDCPEDNGGYAISDFAAIHASPPCQAYSRMNRIISSDKHPRLIAQVRRRLEATGKPFVIENVEGSELQPPCLLLCGTMLGLRVRRHRYFEIRPMPVFYHHPNPCACENGVVEGRLIGHRVAGKKPPGRRMPPHFTETQLRAAMGTDWMTTKENREAIPPAYTEYVGKLLLSTLAAGNSSEEEPNAR